MAQRQYSQAPNNSANPQYHALTDVLERAPAHVCLDIAFKSKTINRNQGNAVNLRRWTNATISDTPNPEGVTPASIALTHTDYVGTLSRYARVYEESRYNYDLNQYNSVMGASSVLTDEVASTRERIRYNASRAGTQRAFNSAAHTNRNQVNGPVTLGRLQVVVRALLDAKGEVFTRVEQGGLKQGTSPIEPSFYAFCHTDLQPDLRAIPGFKTIAESPTGKGASMHEFGSVQNVRFFTTSELVPYLGQGAAVGATGMLSAAGVNVDVYPIIICAKNALTSIDLKGSGKMGYGNADIQILDKPDKSDPTNERIYIACSWYDLAMITSEEWLYRLEVGATANPA